jgi:hypothetical protein
MKRKRHTEKQIVAILKEPEAGLKTADLCRKTGSERRASTIGRPSTAGLKFPRQNA